MDLACNVNTRYAEKNLSHSFVPLGGSKGREGRPASYYRLSKFPWTLARTPAAAQKITPGLGVRGLIPYLITLEYRLFCFLEHRNLSPPYIMELQGKLRPKKDCVPRRLEYLYLSITIAGNSTWKSKEGLTLFSREDAVTITWIQTLQWIVWKALQLHLPHGSSRKAAASTFP